MIDIEEENEGIAGATSRLFDEESGHFSSQKVDRINRQGYIWKDMYPYRGVSASMMMSQRGNAFPADGRDDHFHPEVASASLPQDGRLAAIDKRNVWPMYISHTMY